MKRGDGLAGNNAFTLGGSRSSGGFNVTQASTEGEEKTELASTGRCDKMSVQLAGIVDERCP